MDEVNDLMRQRKEKLNEIREAGIDPYPHQYAPTHTTAGIRKEFASANETPDEAHRVTIAGRIMTKRDHGKSSFAHLQDSTGQMQIYVRRDDVGPDSYRIYRRFDVGDIIGAGVSFFVPGQVN